MPVLNEIQKERDAQKLQFDKTNDLTWTPGEWAALVSRYATRSVSGDLRSIDILEFRSDMIKAAALALACVETIDFSGLA
jgi:hypothetical protein